MPASSPSTSRARRARELAGGGQRAPAASSSSTGAPNTPSAASPSNLFTQPPWLLDDLDHDAEERVEQRRRPPPAARSAASSVEPIEVDEQHRDLAHLAAELDARAPAPRARRPRRRGGRTGRAARSRSRSPATIAVEAGLQQPDLAAVVDRHLASRSPSSTAARRASRTERTRVGDRARGEHVLSRSDRDDAGHGAQASTSTAVTSAVKRARHARGADAHSPTRGPAVSRAQAMQRSFVTRARPPPGRPMPLRARSSRPSERAPPLRRRSGDVAQARRAVERAPVAARCRARSGSGPCRRGSAPSPRTSQSDDFARARTWRWWRAATPTATGSMLESWFPATSTGPDRGQRLEPLDLHPPPPRRERRAAPPSRRGRCG